ncbi:MAG: GAF domain-containing protein, partial [Chloroflexota bacterium]
MSSSLSTTIAGDELNEVMPRIAALLAGSVAADRCAIFVYSAEQTETIAVYRHGYTKEMLLAHGRMTPMAPADIPVEAEIIRTGQAIQRTFPDDVQRWPMIEPDQFEREGRWRDLILPLTWNGQVQGVSYIWRAGDPSPFTDDDVAAASAVGGLAALAIVFARQYQQERVLRQRLDSLLDVATIATSDVGIDEILQSLARAIRDATEADICSLYVLGSDANSALISYQDGVDESEREMFLESHQTLVSEVPAARRASETLRPQIVRDFASDLAPDSALARLVADRPISEILLVPMVFQGRMTGVVYAWRRD